MAGDGLLGSCRKQGQPRSGAAPRGEPRLREPMRDQVELRAVDIDSLIGQDHPARVIWTYVEGLELNELEDRVKGGEQARPSGAIATAAAGALAVRHKRRCGERASVATGSATAMTFIAGSVAGCR